MRQVKIELLPELHEVLVGDDLLARLEEGAQVFLEVHELARPGPRELEGARVHAHDVVHRMVVVEGDGGRRVDQELLAAEHGRPRDRADRSVRGARPAAAKHAHRVREELAHEPLAVRVAVADEADPRAPAPRFCLGRRHGVVRARNAVHRQVREVAEPDLLEAPLRVTLLREEEVVRLDRLEGQHPERVVGKEIHEGDVEPRLHAPDQRGRDRPALDHQDDAGAPGETDPFEPAQDPALVRGLRPTVLVERVVPAIRDRADLAPGRAALNFSIAWHAHIWVTTLEILGGFALAGAGGVALGVAIAWSGTAARALVPFLVVVNTLPKVAVAPLFLLWLGYGVVPNMLIAALIGFFPVVINTAVGLTQIDEELLDLGRVFGAPKWKVFVKIRLPNALPYVLSALKITATAAVVGAIVGEFVASQAGLGMVIVTAQTNLNTPVAFAALGWISIIGLTLYGAVGLATRWWAPWADTT